MSRFEESVKNGLMKVEQTKRNIEQIESIFSELNSEIRKVTEKKVSFEKIGPEPIHIWAASMRPNTTQNKNGRLALKNSTNGLEVVALWEQEPDGYPFTVNYDGQRHDCWDEESLVQILGSIISSGSFWIKVNKLK